MRPGRTAARDAGRARPPPRRSRSPRASRRRGPLPPVAHSSAGPRHRPVERPVELEHARPVAGSAAAGAVRGGSRSPARPRICRGVTSRRGRARRRELVERADHAAPGLDLAAERAEVRRERVGDRLGAATRERPADRVREQAEDEPERGRQRAGRAAGSSAPRARRRAPARGRPRTVRERDRRAQRGHAEPGEQERPARHGQRREQHGSSESGLADERRDQPPVGRPVGAESRRRLVERALEHDRRPSSSGCASGAGGWIHSRPCCSSASP